MSGMCRIELGPKAGDICVVPSDQTWIDSVKALAGTKRMKAIEPTLRGYVALRLQSVDMLRTLVLATAEQVAGLRLTLEALSEIGWDPGTRVEIQSALREGWETQVTGHRADFLRRAVNRCLLGPVQPAMEGEASKSGPAGSRETVLSDN